MAFSENFENGLWKLSFQFSDIQDIQDLVLWSSKKAKIECHGMSVFKYVLYAIVILIT